MTPRLRCLPRPAATEFSGAALGGMMPNVHVAPAARGGITRVPRFAVVRTAPPVTAASNGPTPPPAAAGGGSQETLRDLLSGLVEELAGEKAPATKKPSLSPASVAEEPPPAGPLPGRGVPWRRAPSPWTGVASFPRSDTTRLT